MKEIDGKSISLVGGESVLLNEKTEYLRETGDDPAPAKLSDITKGTFVYFGTTPDKRLAVVVVIGLIQPPKPDGEKPPTAPFKLEPGKPILKEGEKIVLPKGTVVTKEHVNGEANLEVIILRRSSDAVGPSVRGKSVNP